MRSIRVYRVQFRAPEIQPGASPQAFDFHPSFHGSRPRPVQKCFATKQT
jgi:hypothetical protein